MISIFVLLLCLQPLKATNSRIVKSFYYYEFNDYYYLYPFEHLSNAIYHFIDNVICNIIYFDCNKVTEFTFKFYTFDFQNIVFNYLHLLYNLCYEKLFINSVRSFLAREL